MKHLGHCLLADNKYYSNRTGLKVSVLHHDPLQMSVPAHPLLSHAVRLKDDEYDDTLTSIKQPINRMWKRDFFLF